MSEKPSVKIFVVGFDTASAPDSDIFVPIQAGHDVSFFSLGVLTDATGENISKLNQYYAEMTAMYWVWKNYPRTDYVGFFHYRRFLDMSGRPAMANADLQFDNFGQLNRRRYGWTEEAIHKALEGNDIIVPPLDLIKNPENYQTSCSIYDQYVCYHVARDIDVMIAEARKCTDPKILREALDSHRAVFNHVYIMRWELFDEYMSWAFSILENVRPKIALDQPIYAKGEVQSRVLGYLGERLFNVYLEKKRREGAAIKHVPRAFGRGLPRNKPKSNWRFLTGRAVNRAFEYRRIRRGFQVTLLGVSFLYYRPY